MRGRDVLIAGALATFVLAPPGLGSAGAASGLRGVVKTNSGGACLEGSDCLRPAGGVTLVFRRHGRVAARATTRPGGMFRVRLRPGRYAVAVRDAGAIARLFPTSVRVPSGRFGHVAFRLDTGVRAP